LIDIIDIVPCTIHIKLLVLNQDYLRFNKCVICDTCSNAKTGKQLKNIHDIKCVVD